MTGTEHRTSSIENLRLEAQKDLDGSLKKQVKLLDLYGLSDLLIGMFFLLVWMVPGYLLRNAEPSLPVQLFRFVSGSGLGLHGHILTSVVGRALFPIAVHCIYISIKKQRGNHKETLLVELGGIWMRLADMICTCMELPSMLKEGKRKMPAMYVLSFGFALLVCPYLSGDATLADSGVLFLMMLVLLMQAADHAGVFAVGTHLLLHYFRLNERNYRPRVMEMGALGFLFGIAVILADRLMGYGTKICYVLLYPVPLVLCAVSLVILVLHRKREGR